MDVYQLDYDLLNFENRYSHVIILSYGDRYYGHVYIVNKDDPDDLISIIGIRSSLYNLLCENHGFKNTANYILNSYLIFGRFLECETITIEHPIGIMIEIANKFGFDSDFHFQTLNGPNVAMGEYNITYEK